MEITAIGDENRKYFRKMTGELTGDQGALGVVIDGVPAGAGVFSLDDDVAVIDSIYIREDYRRRKAATFLLTDVMETFSEAGAKSILAYYQEDEGLTLFLKSLGFTCIPTDPVFSFLARDLMGTTMGLSFVNTETPDGIVSLSSLDPAKMKELAELLEGADYDGKALIKDCNPGISYAFMKAGACTGVIMAAKEGDDIFVPFFYSAEPSDMKIFLALITMITKMILHEASDTGRVYYIGQNTKVTEMLERLLPGRRAPRREAGTWSAVKYIESEQTGRFGTKQIQE